MPIRQALGRANWYSLPLTGSGTHSEWKSLGLREPSIYRPRAVYDDDLELHHTAPQDLRYWHETHVTYGDFSPIMIRTVHGNFAVTLYLSRTAPLRELGA